MKATLKNYKKIFVIAGAVLILLIALGVLSFNMVCNEMELVHSSMVTSNSRISEVK